MKNFFLILLFAMMITIKTSLEKSIPKETPEKFNFASIEQGAKLLENNKIISHPKSILNEDKDKYLLVPRTTENKFIIIELSEEIIIEKVAFVNYEYYSCTFKDIIIYGSQNYPCSNKDCWEELGRFSLINKIRITQKFDIIKPTVTRYLKIIFLTEYGKGF
jgi:hypothetical protein